MALARKRLFTNIYKRLIYNYHNFGNSLWFRVILYEYENYLSNWEFRRRGLYRLAKRVFSWMKEAHAL